MIFVLPKKSIVIIIMIYLVGKKVIVFSKQSTCISTRGDAEPDEIYIKLRFDLGQGRQIYS